MAPSTARQEVPVAESANQQLRSKPTNARAQGALSVSHLPMWHPKRSIGIRRRLQRSRDAPWQPEHGPGCGGLPKDRAFATQGRRRAFSPGAHSRAATWQALPCPLKRTRPNSDIDASVRMPPALVTHPRSKPRCSWYVACAARHQPRAAAPRSHATRSQHQEFALWEWLVGLSQPVCLFSWL